MKMERVNMKSHVHHLNEFSDNDKLFNEERIKEEEELKIEDCHGGSSNHINLNEI